MRKESLGKCGRTYDDALVGTVLLGQLSPDAGELCVRGTTLGDDGTVPPRVVVQVEDDVYVRSGVECSLNSCIVAGQE